MEALTGHVNRWDGLRGRVAFAIFIRFLGINMNRQKHLAEWPSGSGNPGVEYERSFLGGMMWFSPPEISPGLTRELGCIGEVREQGAAHGFGGLCTDDVK